MIKTPISRRRLILFAAVLIFILGLAYVMRDFVRQYILQPLIDMGWLVWVELQTVPQTVFWALFVLVAMVIAIRSLWGGRADSLGRYISRPISKYTQSSRYTHWKVNLDAMHSSPFARERIERELQNLALQVMADHARVDFEEIRERQNHGLLDLSAESPAIRALFAIDHRKRFMVPSTNLPAWLAWLLRRTPAPDPSGNPGLDLEGIITWLEEQTGQRDLLIPESSNSRDPSVHASVL